MGRILDKNLVEAAQRGDAEALRALIEATRARLYKFCLLICGDPVKAEDLCQEAYLKVFTHLKKIKNPEAFMDWLFRTTRNLHLDQVRRRTETPMAAKELSEVSGRSEIPSEYYSVRQVLSRFEAEDQWLILLVDMEDYSYREAAEHLGITEDAVRSRIFRLRKEFAERWKKLETK